MDIEEFKSFLKENQDNDDLKSVVTEVFKPNSLEDALKSFDGSKEMRSFMDRVETKAIERYKSNHGEELEKKAQQMAEERLQQMNQKDPKDLELEKLRKDFEMERRERLVEKNRNLALSLLQEKKLPSSFSDFLVSDDEDETKQRFEKFSSVLDDVLTQTKESALSGVKSDVPTSTSKTADGEPGPDASKEEWIEYYKNNKK